jgi:hypothetical protein
MTKLNEIKKISLIQPCDCKVTGFAHVTAQKRPENLQSRDCSCKIIAAFLSYGIIISKFSFDIFFFFLTLMILANTLLCYYVKVLL